MQPKFMVLGTLLIGSFATSVFAQDWRQILPHGRSSFADKVVEFNIPGGPFGKDRVEDVLNPPNFETPGRGDSVTLGCSGHIVVRFDDNALVDVAGPDLYVWEVGTPAEPTALSVSNDGTNWEFVGQISGSTVEIDIGNYDLKRQAYRYVKLQDLKSDCQNNFPGADIDSIAAVGSAKRYIFSSEVLFDLDKSTLRTDAEQALKEFFSTVDRTSLLRIDVEGHTDSQGSIEYNETLGSERAQAVAKFLASLDPSISSQLDVNSRGELEPIATNKTPAGRQANRRVELIVVLK